MQRKKVPAGHHRFGLARLVLVLALLFLVVALTAGLAGCLSFSLLIVMSPPAT